MRNTVLVFVLFVLFVLFCFVLFCFVVCLFVGQSDSLGEGDEKTFGTTKLGDW